MTTCSKNFDRLLQAACLGLVGMLAVAGCGGSSSNPAVKDASRGPDGITNIPPPDGGPAGTLSIDKVTVTFGSVDVNVPSPAQVVTITNSGAQAVAIVPTISGSGAFSITDTCASVPAAGSCTVSVAFQPTAVGRVSGVLSITPTLAVSLSGTGVPLGSFSVAGVNLGDKVATNASVTGSVTVQATVSVTDLACSVSGVDLTADPAKVCPAALAAGASCTVGFTFKATSPGSKSDSVVCSAAGLSKTAIVTATVFDTAKLVITPDKTTFQTQNGTPSSAVNFGVANSGGLSTGQISATLGGVNADQFAITVPGCLAPLAGSTGCSLQVVCTPTSVGTKSATLNVVDTTGAAASVSAALTCVSVGPTTLTVTGTANLGSVVIGNTGTPQNFTVKNTGTAASGTLTVTISDAQFVKGSDTCTGISLDANATCSVVVSLHPTAAGSLNAILNVTAASGNPGFIQLSGIGLTAGVLTVSPSSYDFLSIPNNSVSADASFTVTNGGGASTGALTVSSPGNGFVVAGNGCSAALAPGKTCVFAVHFAPTVEGNATATVTVGDGTISATATLHGTSVPEALLTIDKPVTCAGPADRPTAPAVSHHAFDPNNPCASDNTFAATVIGQTNGSYGLGAAAGAGGSSGTVSAPAGITFVVTNSDKSPTDTGAVTVKTTGAAAGDFVISKNTCPATAPGTLRPGDTCMITVDFTPTAAGARAATLQVTTVKGGATSATLNGLGLPVIEILPCSNKDGTVVNDDPWGTCTPLDSTLGTNFGQVPLGVFDPNHIDNQQKLFVVRVRGSNAANHQNTLSLSLTTSASPADFRVAAANEHATPSNLLCQGFVANVSSAVQECIVWLDFYPQSGIGDKTGTLTINGSAGGTASVDVSGTATGPLTFDPSPVDFGTVEVGTVAVTSTTLTIDMLVTQTVTVTNYGASTQGPLSFTITGTNAAEFATVDDNCSNQKLANLEHCTLSFIMIPATEGAKTATLTVISGALSSTVQFIGNGKVSALGAKPISVAPLTVDFAKVAVNAPSDWTTITVSLNGTAETGNIDYALSCGTGISCLGFEIAQAPGVVGTCGVSDTRHLGGANPTSCTIKVRFNPTSLNDGAVAADELTLMVSEVRSTQEVDVTLTGIATPQLALSALTHDFGSVPSGQASATYTFTVTNVGATTYTGLAVTSVNPNDPNSAYVPLNTNGTATTCGVSGILDPNTQCVVVVSLTAPALAPGALTLPVKSTLVVGNASGNNFATASITATAVKKATIEAVGLTQGLGTYGNYVDLGIVPQGLKSSDVTIYYTNTGAVPATGMHFLWTDYSSGVVLLPPSLTQDMNDPYFVFAEVAPANSCIGKASLAPGEICAVSFHLAASSGVSGGVYYAELDVYATNAAHAQAITAWGYSTASTGASTITPSFFNFNPTGSTVTGTSSTAQVFQLNAGTASGLSGTLTPGSTGFPNQGDFIINPHVGASPCNADPNDPNDPTVSLAANGSCTFSVTFHPQSSADQYRLGSVTVSGSTVSAGFIGKVPKPATLAIKGPTAGNAFGDVLYTATSTAMPLTITNTGEVASDALTLVVGALDPNTSVDPDSAGSNADVAKFTVGTTCNKAIAAGETCSFTLTVSPGATGLIPASTSYVLEVEANATSGIKAYSTPVTARGVLPAGLALTPANPTAFPDQPVGSTVGTISKTFTIQNGNAAAALPTQSSGPLTISVSDATNFVLDPNGCDVAADPNGPGLVDTDSCTVTVSFKPDKAATLGALPVTLSVSSSHGGNKSVTVQAKAIAPLAFVATASLSTPSDPGTGSLWTATPSGLAASPVDFGDLAVGTLPVIIPTAHQVIRLWVENAAGAPHTGILTTAKTGSDFRIIADNCVGVQLGVDNSESEFCNIDVRFEPSSSGAKTGSVTVSGTPGHSATIALAGNGL